MKKIYKQGLVAVAVVVLVIAMGMVSCTSSGRRPIKYIPISSDSTTGVTIGNPPGTKLKGIRVLCSTQGCVLVGATGSDSSSAPGPSKINVSYRTPVDVPAGSVIKLELQLSPESTDHSDIEK